MRFCHLPSPGASSLSGKKALASHQRIGATTSGAKCDQPASNVFSPPTTPLEQIVDSTHRPRNLTEFPFERNFSKPDLEGHMMRTSKSHAGRVNLTKYVKVRGAS